MKFKFLDGDVTTGGMFADRKFGGHFADLGRAEKRTEHYHRKLIDSVLSTGKCWKVPRRID